MTTSTENSFWTLNEAKDIVSEDDFYEILNKSNRLENLSYKPEKLNRRLRWIKKRTFTKVSFSWTEISDVGFVNCTFDKCLFIGTKIKNSVFRNCRFVSTNMYKVSISGTYIDPRSFRECLHKKEHQNIGVGLYQQLLKNYRDEDQIEFEREAQFQFYRWKRLQVGWEVRNSLRERDGETSQWETIKKALNFFGRSLWEGLLGSGVRLRRFFLTAIISVFALSVMNYYFSQSFGLCFSGGTLEQIISAFYYTTISLTTLGYGDIVPKEPVGQVAAIFQSVFGFFMFAMLASMLYRRVAP